jgi:thioredoxin-dependent peroxiredoxin
MAEEGDRAPEFELPDQDGNTHRLADYAGKNVVLYFYPKAMTSGCTVQACGVRDRATDYQQANAVVLGVSPDPQVKLREFADKEGLQFTLLGDQDHSVADKYGVLGAEVEVRTLVHGVRAIDVRHRAGREDRPRVPKREAGRT